jgi:5-methylcytosine-specific restriction enzyme subunit McrC
VTTLVTVREYARLTSSTLAEPSLDRQQVSQSAFDWLCRLSSKLSKSGASLVELEDRKWLRLDNYVGVIETPCGTRVEILPKHLEEGESLEATRSLLVQMICTTFHLPTREVGPSSLQKFNAPLNEWVMKQFLASLDHLIKRGIRSEYHLVEEVTCSPDCPRL